GIPRTAGGSPVVSSALKDVQIISKPFGEASLQSANRRLATGGAPILFWESPSKETAPQAQGSTDTLPCLPSVWVRGLEVHITPESINSLYWVEPIQPHSIFRKKVEDTENQFQWVANMIALSQ
ncbi:hypothetical protein HAX54_013045, partial [Datura stramonium]|nr:hypothetical protein [Datura stramonium]